MYDAGTDTPLFGDTRPRDRFLSYLLGGFTCVLVLFTFISSLFPWPPPFKKIFLAIAIIFVCIGELVLIFWYKRGDLDPKFRKLILFNCLSLIILCLSANLFYYPK
ncbi:transmembrane protein 243-like [Actinia tenebrosa]|uniref:Transmembrane protein 243-like n=1 Tax=Actinia tenebrosa TaxID=6105 RepID=A0A6P8IU96_ACTTE|nr:transmembrane protein 243-like [Actinia tenebrosa]